MKLLQISFHFEFSDQIEALLDQHEVPHFVRYPRVQGLDRDGRQYGSKVFPGHLVVIQARVEDPAVDGLLDELRQFRERKQAHAHLEALVIAVEQWIGPEQRSEARERQEAEQGD